MKIWMRKIAVAFVAFITLGLYVPSFDVDAHVGKAEKTFDSSKANIIAEQITTYDVEEEDVAATLMEKAIAQTSVKFGPKIENQLENEFQDVILPKMEETLRSIFTEAGEDRLPFYEITENPAQGYGERIFNVYDVKDEKIIAKFHVRRDFKPQEGYWFNFHYHLRKDQFETHYELGNIYWDKNMPPKWMAQ